MEKEQFLKLQNGSDVRGIAVTAEGHEQNMSPEIAGKIAAAFSVWLAERLGRPVSELRIGIGHDSRITAEDMKQGVLAGLGEAQAFDCGMVSTPAMFLSTILEESGFDGAVMITASHLPFYCSGLKFFTKEGGLESVEVKTILAAAAGAALPSAVREAESFPLKEAYCGHIREIIRREVQAENYALPLAGLHIVVDAGNGAAGFFAGDILEALGADTSGSVFLDPDGTFPNHVPDPERADAMAAVRSAVLSAGADLGVIFDCDGDRAAVVFGDGTEANRNTLIALMAAILREKYPGSTIVTDSITSDELTEFIESTLGLKHFRFRRGYKNVINKALELNAAGIECPLAIETSGHGALKENYFSDDGAYLSVKVICKMAQLKKEGRRIEELLAELRYPADAAEFRFRILEEDFQAYGRSVLEDLRETAKAREDMTLVEPNYEGIRIAVQNEEVRGWLLLRMSLHEPVMPLNIEARASGGVEKIRKILEPFVRAHSGLAL